jgi:hypothetical protein
VAVVLQYDTTYKYHTSHKITHHIQTKHSTQNYKNNKDTLYSIHNEYNENILNNYNKYNYNYINLILIKNKHTIH